MSASQRTGYQILFRLPITGRGDTAILQVAGRRSEVDAGGDESIQFIGAQISLRNIVLEMCYQHRADTPNHGFNKKTFRDFGYFALLSTKSPI